MPHAYLLQCADGSYYVGNCRSLDERLFQDAAGRGARYTSTRLPVQLVWSQESDRIDEAWAMERRIHGWSRAKKAALVRGDWAKISRLSRSRIDRARLPAEASRLR